MRTVRLLPLGDDMFEVQSHGRKIGMVWHFKGRWHGETSAGTQVRAALAQGRSKEHVGMEVERLHREGH